MIRNVVLLFLFSIICLNVDAQLRAGVSKKIITPELPFLLTGYASRTTPAAGKLHDLWAKALVIESSAKSRTVIVTTDVLGLTPKIHDEVVAGLRSKLGFQKSQIILNSSHTHSGPMIWPSLEMIGDYDSSAVREFLGYKTFLVQSIIDVVENAVTNKFSAKLSSGHGEAKFAMNRRQLANGKIINGKNPEGNTDHDVPVLKVEDSKGNIKAILFGYACHNTTLGGNNYFINGDYAGFAQIDIEKTYPGATALYFTGCAGDQNPQPRGTVELAQQHGNSLATAVKNVLASSLKPVNGVVKSTLQETTLNFVPYKTEEYEADVLNGNQFEKRRARLMLQALNQGWDITKYQYPVQAMRIGNSLTFVSLAGEVVVDYALKLKKMYPKENLFVAGYCNHVMGYIPTKKVLEEGGYEAVENLIYYGKPGPFAKDVESRIFATLESVMKNVGVK